MRWSIATAGGDGLRIGLIFAAFGFGFRHGIDWDHLAAIADLTGSQENRRRSMVLATLYALGHAAVVLALGVFAITFSERLPASVDTMMERFVGVTLLVLGAYVLMALVRNGRDFRLRSRWMLVIAVARRALSWASGRRARGKELVVIEHEHEHDHVAGEMHVHDHVHAHAQAAAVVGVGASRSHGHRHRHLVAMPADPFPRYGSVAAVGIGAIHGIGAETPTQILIFLSAAGAAGTGAGVLLLVCFVAGLLVSNTAVAAAATWGGLGAARRLPLYLAVSLTTALLSLFLGVIFVFGQSESLPAFFGG